jgi:hypothetical protein
MGSWTNSDGLKIFYGTDAALGAQVGATSSMGPFKYAHAILEVSRMDLTGGLIGGKNNVVIPAGSYITRAFLIIHEAFTGASGTLDLGLAIADGTYTGGDEDGIDAAIAVATLLQGTIIACDGAMVGAGADKDTTVDLYLSYDIDTTDFTAGKAELIVEWLTPLAKSMTAAD